LTLFKPWSVAGGAAGAPAFERVDAGGPEQWVAGYSGAVAVLSRAQAAISTYSTRLAGAGIG
jgi:hypothetical protein